VLSSFFGQVRDNPVNGAFENLPPCPRLLNEFSCKTTEVKAFPALLLAVVVQINLYPGIWQMHLVVSPVYSDRKDSVAVLRRILMIVRSP
jgi:hypothetical protein